MSNAALALVLLAGSLARQEPAAEPEPPGKKVERIVLPRGERRAPLHMELWRASEDPATPMLVLYHEARSSKGEYRPIVPRLRELGYNCLAVDLSSGNVCREIKNLTARRASESGRAPTYLDSLPDIVESLTWARETHAHGKLVAWGSSYSGSLALQVAAEHPELVDGVIAFSPGEYFTSVGKSATWIQESAGAVVCPVFVASAHGEESDWQPIFAALSSTEKTGFAPPTGGAHGSRALWPESKGNEQYWAALEPFLRRHFPASAPATPPVEKEEG